MKKISRRNFTKGLVAVGVIASVGDVFVNQRLGPLLVEGASDSQIALDEKWLKHPKNTFVLKMKGASMEPLIPDGSLVVVDTLDRDPADGMIFAIRAKNNCVIRRLSLQKDAMHFLPERPSSTNRPFHFNKRAENPIIGKAIWVFNKLKKRRS